MDHGSAALWTADLLERERGITIFSKQAVLPLGDMEVTLLDTPGHVDFSAEMERTLQVLDYAILVISGTDGVQAHTRTLWRLLERYQIPTFLFVNKMDLAGGGPEAAAAEQLQQRLGERLRGLQPRGPESVHGGGWPSAARRRWSAYLDSGEVSDDAGLRQLVGRRQAVPLLVRLRAEAGGGGRAAGGAGPVCAACRPIRQTFGARVYKIARDAQGSRLTYLKVTGGTPAGARRPVAPAGRDRLGGEGGPDPHLLRRPSSGRWSEAPAGTRVRRARV